MVVPGGAHFFPVETRLAGYLEFGRTSGFGFLSGGVSPDASSQERRGDELSIAMFDHLLHIKDLLPHG